MRKQAVNAKISDQGKRLIFTEVIGQFGFYMNENE